MAEIVGEVTGPADRKQVLLIEAFQAALEKAPPPPLGTDVQSFRLVSVELEHGGFTNATRTRVTLDLENGPLK